MRIVFAGGGTGGHLYPGLAVARRLVRLDPSVRPLFVGARRGIERDVLPTTEFEHILLDLHPLYPRRPWQNWRTVAGFAGAWRALGRMVREERPSAVVGLGGYASGAGIAYAAARRIPIAIMEQDSHAGKATRLFSRVADEIYLGYEEAARMLSPRHGAFVGVLGNPITPPPDVPPGRAAALARWKLPLDSSGVVLVFGGSQGARALNEVVDAWIARGLPDGLSLIWGTGRGTYEQFAHRASARVSVHAYLSPIEEAYAAADLAVTRAGALTLAELCAWGLPSLLVPLPTAAADHQTRNAASLERAGAAIMLRQRELTPPLLDVTVRGLLDDAARLRRMTDAALSRARPHAADAIARRILDLAGRSGARA